jgi:hypothetical protein
VRTSCADQIPLLAEKIPLFVGKIRLFVEIIPLLLEVAELSSKALILLPTFAYKNRLDPL